MIPDNFLTPDEENQVVEAIRVAEKNTSGEIRVHLEKDMGNDSLGRALKVFYELGMQNTAQRNGVLFHVNIEKKIFSVLGDKGINEIVPSNFWDSIKDKVIAEFRNQNYAKGLVAGILEVGDKLKQYFPHQKDDVNELSDEISKNY